MTTRKTPVKDKTSAKTSTSKAVATKEEAELSPLVAGWLNEMEDGETGFEDETTSDSLIPFFKLLQDNSPLVEQGGAQAGQFLNTATGEILDSLVIIPCHREIMFIEREPYVPGKVTPPINTYSADHQVVVDSIAANGGNAFGMNRLNSRNTLSETVQLYCLIQDPEDKENWNRGVIAFASRRLNDWKTLYNRARTQTFVHAGIRRPFPLWSHSYKLGSEVDPKSAQGQRTFKFTVSWSGENALTSRFAVDSIEMHDAMEYRSMVKKGEIKTADDGGEDAPAPAQTTGAPRGGDVGEDSIPF